MGCIIDFIIEFIGEIVFEGVADLMHKAYDNIVITIISFLLFVAGVILLITGSIYSSATETVLGWTCLGISLISFIVGIILLIIKK